MNVLKMLMSLTLTLQIHETLMRAHPLPQITAYTTATVHDQQAVSALKCAPVST